MLPMVPLASFPVHKAKRVWLICNLAFLLITIWLLSRVTRFSVEQIWLLAFCGYISLYTNFSYGQYYVFLLFLLTASFYFLFQRCPAAGGFVAGLALALKLYGGPFLLLFLAKRKWRAAAGMSVATVLFGFLAIRLFGWSDVHYYLTQVLPSVLSVIIIDNEKKV
jgi:Glycosyltransferase family 87